MQNFQKLELDSVLPNSFFGANSTLISQSDKSVTRKLQTIITYETDKSLNQLLTKYTNIKIESKYDPVELIPGYKVNLAFKYH